MAAYLLPAGKRHGAEWRVGSADGDAGKSLSVRIKGDKAGVWADFAADQHGDLLDLWCAVRRCSVSDAMREAKQWAGVRDEPTLVSAPRLYARPQRPQAKRPSGAALQWLRDRGLTDDTIADFKLGAEGDVVALPYLRDGELVNIKRRSVTDKRRMWQEKDAEPCLFGWHLIEPSCRVVAITEGEFDAMVLHQAGIPALSVNQGAGNHQWIDSDWERLHRFSEILVCFDDDDAGRKGAREVAQRRRSRTMRCSPGTPRPRSGLRAMMEGSLRPTSWRTPPTSRTTWLPSSTRRKVLPSRLRCGSGSTIAGSGSATRKSPSGLATTGTARRRFSAWCSSGLWSRANGSACSPARCRRAS